MELRTEAVDRVLEALSPALTAEIERVLEENRQLLEAEFQNRLRSAVRQAEEEARLTADAERHQAVENAIEDTGATVRQQVTAELQTEFERRLDETRETARQQVTAELQSEFDRRIEGVSGQATTELAAARKAQADWDEERTRLQQQIDKWRLFAECHRQLTEAASQAEILARWLNFAAPFAASVALYSSKSGGLTLWKTCGEGVFPQLISQATSDPESYFKPVVVRGKQVAAVSATLPFRAEALDFLTTTLERAIELFGLRLRNK